MLFRNLGVFGRKRAGLGSFSPVSISGLQLWLDADDSSTIIKDGSDFVSKWTDKSINAYEFNQLTGSAQPKYISSGFGTESKPHLLFDGVNDLLRTTANVIDLTTDFTIFAVHQSDAATTDGMVFSTVGGSAGIFYRYVNNTQMRIFIQASNSFTTGLNQNITMLSTMLLDRAANETDNSINTTDYPTDPVSTVTTHQNFLTIGANGSGSSPMEGKITEIIYYNSKLSIGDQSLVKDYLNSKYGIY